MSAATVPGVKTQRLGTSTVTRRVVTTDGIARVTVSEPAGPLDVVRLTVETPDGDTVMIAGVGATWLRRLAGDLLDAAEGVQP